jgi:hypothetical protein
MSTAPTRYVILAHRDTGQIETFEINDALSRLSTRQWSLVCSEDEPMPPLNADERAAKCGREIILSVDCLQQHSGSCQMENRSVHVGADPATWDADDMCVIETVAGEEIGSDCLLWSVEIERDTQRTSTKLTIEQGRKRQRIVADQDKREQYPGFHRFKFTHAGPVSAITLAWLLRQAKRVRCSFITDIGESPDPTSWRTLEDPALEKMPATRRGRKTAADAVTR